MPHILVSTQVRLVSNCGVGVHVCHRLKITCMAVTRLLAPASGQGDSALEKLTVNSSIDLPCRICYFHMLPSIYPIFVTILYECSQTRSKATINFFYKLEHIFICLNACSA